MKRYEITAWLLTLLLSACAAPSVQEKSGDWAPTPLAVVPAPERGGAPRFNPEKFSSLDYGGWKPRAVRSLGEVDLGDLRENPRRYEIIAVGPVSWRQYGGRTELLDQLAFTHRLSREQKEILTRWVETGGVLWVEFGVFLQGYEWTQNPERRLPPLPDLTGFTVFGLPTHSLVFETRRIGAFSIEPKIFRVQNEAEHAATAGIRVLRLVQAHLKAVYPIVTAPPGQILVREGEKVYASVTGYGQGKIVSTVPFSESGFESDGDRYRGDVAKWLHGSSAGVVSPDRESQKRAVGGPAGPPK